MSPYPVEFVPHLRTHPRDICDLPAEILLHIFSLLHGQDITRCTGVCRLFADLIHSDFYLPYRIELAQHGMVDGESSTLPISERLKRLHQYSSNLRNGIFNHEDLAAHPEYVNQFRNLDWNMSMRTDDPTSVLFGNITRSDCFLSVFTHGSAQAGVKSRRWLMPIGTPGDRTRWTSNWVIDRAQDLIVTVEIVHADRQKRLVEVRFCSLSGSTTSRMDHSAAMLPCKQVCRPPDGDEPVQIHLTSLCIAGSYAIWGLLAVDGQVEDHSIEICNWKTGQTSSRIDLGANPMDVASLGDSYLLVTPQSFDSEPYLNIYSILSTVPHRPFCTLQLPGLKPGESVLSCHLGTSHHPPALGSHFCPDPSQSMVILTYCIRGSDGRKRGSYLLIPYTTLFAHIRAAIPIPGTLSDNAPESQESPVPVPWKDWGPHGCLRLRLRPARRNGRLISLIPSGSRMPVVGFEGPTASVYMFDVSPLAARHARTARCDDTPRLEGENTAIVENVEAVLPGVVDPECATIPYVVYRFRLPHPPWEHDAIRAVRMSMTGFTVTFDDVGLEQQEQTWTI